MEIHGNRYSRSVNTRNEHAHTNHTAEHMGRKFRRQKAHRRQHKAIDNNENQGQHGHPKDEFIMIPPLNQKVPGHHGPKGRFCFMI